MAVMIRWSPEKPYVPYLFDDETEHFLPVPWVFGLIPEKKKNRPARGAWIRDVVFGGEVYQFKFHQERPKKKGKNPPEEAAKEEKPTWVIRMMGRYQQSIGDPRERRVAVFRSQDLESWGVELYKPLLVEKGTVIVPEWAKPIAGRVSVAQLAHCEAVEGQEEEYALTLTPAMVGSSDGVDYDIFLPLFDKSVFGGELRESTMQGTRKKLKLGEVEYRISRYYDGGEYRTHHLTVEGQVWMSIFPMLFERDNLPRELVDANSRDGYLWFPIVKRADVAHSGGGKLAGVEEEAVYVEESYKDDAAQPDEVVLAMD